MGKVKEINNKRGWQEKKIILDLKDNTHWNFAPEKIQSCKDNNGNAITVDSLLILLLGFPSASIISKAYNSL